MSTHGAVALAEWKQSNGHTRRHACQACAERKQRCDGNGLVDCRNCTSRDRLCIYRISSANASSAPVAGGATSNEPRDFTDVHDQLHFSVSQIRVPDVVTVTETVDYSSQSTQDLAIEPTPTVLSVADAALRPLEYEPPLENFLSSPGYTYPFSSFPRLGYDGIPDFSFGNDILAVIASPLHEQGVFDGGSAHATSMAADVDAVPRHEILVAEEEDMLASEYIPHVPHIDVETRECMIRNLEADLPQKESEALASVFPSLRHLDAYIQLYFEHFHARMPFLHVPTFQVSPGAWRLVLAVACIGSQYSTVSQKPKHRALLHRLSQHMMKNDVSEHKQIGLAVY